MSADNPNLTKPCKIVGPYLPAGDVEWRCMTHDTPALLIDPTKMGADVLRREDFTCPKTANLTTTSDRSGVACARVDFAAVMAEHYPFTWSGPGQTQTCEAGVCHAAIWPCLPYRLAKAASDLAAQQRATIGALAPGWLRSLLDQQLDDGTPVLEIVFGQDRDLADRWRAALANQPAQAQP